MMPSLGSTELGMDRGLKLKDITVWKYKFFFIDYLQSLHQYFDPKV